MRNSREPILTPVPIASLRPTQITVGLREVERKRLQWRGEGERGGAYLGRHMIPVVLGPKRRPYVIDHHHLARALHDEGQSEADCPGGPYRPCSARDACGPITADRT